MRKLSKLKGEFEQIYSLSIRRGEDSETVWKWLSEKIKSGTRKRDKKNNWPTPRKGELIKSAIKQANQKYKYFFWNGEKLSKVIEFDLPKGYSADDAFQTALWWTKKQKLRPYEITDYNFLWWKDIVKHFGGSFFSDPITTKDRANFFLLLAAANGHKLE